MCTRFRWWRTPSMRRQARSPGHGCVRITARSWVGLDQLRAPVRVTYEAGPTGFGLARAITEAGMECLVAAPSKLQRPAGDRVKTEARDAAHLARLLRLGEITAVRVPEREIEAVRDLVRAREDPRADLMRVRHRLSKLLLRQGIVYSGGTPWTCVHEEWLRRHRFDDIHLKAAFDHSFDAVLAATAARDRLDEQIMVVAASPRFADPVNRLGCLRGISAVCQFSNKMSSSQFQCRRDVINDMKQRIRGVSVVGRRCGVVRRACRSEGRGLAPTQECN